MDLVRERQNQQAQMALTRQRLLTICFEDMETIRMVRIDMFATPRIALTEFTASQLICCEHTASGRRDRC